MELGQRVVGRRPRRQLSRQGRKRDAERRARALLALRPDLAAHQLDEALRDREAKPGAAVAARRRGVDLAE